jgi:hypothetical protein
MRLATRTALATALLVLCFVGAAFAAAAGIDGKWTGQVVGPTGPASIALDLTAADGVLTGSASLFGMTTPVSNGKIAGSDVSFDLVLGGGAFTLPFKGKVEGETLTLSITTPMGAQTVAFVRPPAN